MAHILTRERFIHAAGFEVFAIAPFSPLMAWAVNAELTSAGALTLLISLIAMLWNMTYNGLVDRYSRTPRVHWRLPVRLAHGVLFEAGLVLVCVPLTAWMLGLTLWQACLVELGFFVFILPYTLIYNWAFDKLWYRRRPAMARGFAAKIADLLRPVLALLFKDKNIRASIEASSSSGWTPKP